MSDDWQNNPSGSDANTWKSSEEGNYAMGDQPGEDWQEMMARRADGSFWSDFAPSEEGEETTTTSTEANGAAEEDLVDSAELWLETLASISAEEVEFNMAENERADKARQMAEWGFDSETISNTFGVATDDTLEKDVEGMQAFREESYVEDEDWQKVESHTKVEKDPDTGEPIRQQMVRTSPSWRWAIRSHMPGVRAAGPIPRHPLRFVVSPIRLVSISPSSPIIFRSHPSRSTWTNTPASVAPIAP